MGVALFYSLTYLAVYGLPFLIAWLGILNTLSAIILAHSLLVLSGLAIIYTTLRLRGERFTFSAIGIRKRSLTGSFLWAAAFSTPIPLLWFAGSQILGVETLLVAAKPSWAIPPVMPEVLGLAILSWVLVGVVAFMFWEAFPYELLEGLPVKIRLFLVVVLWAGLYNAPLLTGRLDPGDILFFGLLFTLTYHKTRNSVGVLLAYLLNENPLWWVAAAIFGPQMAVVFMAALTLRMAVCSTSALWVIKARRSKVL
jgi:hypothetical protein